jgi:hypothetical protein
MAAYRALTSNQISLADFDTAKAAAEARIAKAFVEDRGSTKISA